MNVSDAISTYQKLLARAGVNVGEQEILETAGFIKKNIGHPVVREMNEMLLKDLDSIRIAPATEAVRANITKIWSDFQKMRKAPLPTSSVPTPERPAPKKVRNVERWLLIFLVALAGLLGYYIGARQSVDPAPVLAQKLAEQKATFEKERSNWDAACLEAQRKVAEDATAKCSKQWPENLRRNGSVKH